MMIFINAELIHFLFLGMCYHLKVTNQDYFIYLSVDNGYLYKDFCQAQPRPRLQLSWAELHYFYFIQPPT